MKKTHFTSGQKANAKALAAETVVSVDIGFSQNRKSTGVAWRTRDCNETQHAKYRFADAVTEVTTLLKRETTAVLILEAPLSAKFDFDGNPTARLPFEQIDDLQKDKKSNRFWYVGAGASTQLAAIFFLRRLTSNLESHDASLSVTLFEGLHTFKDGPTDHAQDALDLIEAFLAGQVENVSQGEFTDWLSVFQLIDSDTCAVIPAIVTVNKEAPKTEKPILIDPKGADNDRTTL